MKKTLATIATAVLMTLSFSSFANSTVEPINTKEAKEVLNDYVEAISTGKADFNKYTLAKDFQFENEESKLKFGKKAYLKFLNETKGLNYDCEYITQIVEQTDATTIATTSMKFKNFTRVDHITLKKSNNEWKISKITTTYL